MNEDQDWNQLGKDWRAEPQTTSLQPATSQIIRAASRASRRTIVSWTAIVSAVVFITSICVLRRSLETYTFAVIGWSAFFSFGGYYLAVQDRAGDLALATTDALRARSLRLARAIQLLEFARVLVGVETILCAGFWVASRYAVWNHAWIPALLIAISGTLLYLILGLFLARTRRENRCVQSLGSVMSDAD